MQRLKVWHCSFTNEDIPIWGRKRKDKIWCSQYLAKKKFFFFSEIKGWKGNIPTIFFLWLHFFLPPAWCNENVSLFKKKITEDKDLDWQSAVISNGGSPRKRQLFESRPHLSCKEIIHEWRKAVGETSGSPGENQALSVTLCHLLWCWL